MQDTRPLLLEQSDFPVIHRGELTTLQANLGYLCNLSCVHCHVNAGPTRTELMTWETMEQLLNVVDRYNIQCVDLTGGAPELNPHFRKLVVELRQRGVEVIDRCNLTVLFEPGQGGLAGFLAEHGVTITASLPCYSEDNVEKQRGKGVYSSSIEALILLNKLGYGFEKHLQLNLVYNPVGAVLPPSQIMLQEDYQRELSERFGIKFNELFTITNMPISRFGAVLLAHNQYDNYMQLLKDNYSEGNLDTVMCRNLVSIDWQGYLYDCDFNQMLELPLFDFGPEPAMQIGSDKPKPHIRDLLVQNMEGREILVADHCFGCTAGQGSSCGGALD